jgi:hypothetical protein
MKKIFTVVLLVLLVGNVFAGPESIIKQKAKDISNNNNAQQGLPPQYPPAQPATPATPAPKPPAPAAPTAPALAPPQLTPDQAPFARVVADLNTVKADDSDRLGNDLMAMARGANKPSAATVQKLAKDLVTALAGKTLSLAQRTHLAQDIQALLAGTAVPAAQMDGLVADVLGILKKAGADVTATTAVGDDLQAMNAGMKLKVAK